MVALLLLLVVCLLSPGVVAAHEWFCRGGDVPCLIATLGKFQQLPDRQQTLVLGEGTFTLDHADNEEGLEGFNGLPAILGHVTIIGAGPDLTIIERAPTAPFFRLLRATPTSILHLEGLTFQGGELDPRFFFRVGGVASEGIMTIQDSIIRNNSGRLGGGVGSNNTLTLERVVIEHNAAETGAGIAMNGTLTMRQCWVEGNVSDSGAGLAFAPGGKVRIVDSVLLENLSLLTTGGGLEGVGEIDVIRSVLLNNVAGLRGGAISLSQGTLRLRGSTLSGNAAEVFGGGISVEAGEVQALRTAIVNNRTTSPFGVGGGLFNTGGTVSLQQSALAGNQAFQAPDCYGQLRLVGPRNVVGDRSGCDIQE